MNPISSLRNWLAGLALVLACVLGAARLAAADDAAHATAAAVAGQAQADAHDHDHGHAAGPEPTFLRQLGYSYLTAYMFCLSLCVGALFLILIHHLFDAAWSVPVRRIAEQLASLLFPWMVILVIPILILANLGQLHPWLKIDPAEDHSLAVKRVLFNPVAFSILVPLLIASWGWLARRFLTWSLAQDRDGAVQWTYKARVQAAWGIFYYAFTLTLVCFYLMKSLQHQFFSTMYGVYYFAGSVWTTLITMFVLATVLKERGPLSRVVSKRQLQDLAVWFFAFTVFYAYIHFSQYFLIWNAAIPEETFWYVKREAGSWKWVGFTILFGHFFVPFLMLLNQDIKQKPALMFPMAVWAWGMHYVDMTFNVMPVLYPHGLHVTLWDLIFGVGLPALLGVLFWKRYHAAAPYPLRDPRLKEAVTHHHVPAPGEAAAHH
jgi:hypothetical protein